MVTRSLPTVPGERQIPSGDVSVAKLNAWSRCKLAARKTWRGDRGARIDLGDPFRVGKAVHAAVEGAVLAELASWHEDERRQLLVKRAALEHYLRQPAATQWLRNPDQFVAAFLALPEVVRVSGTVLGVEDPWRVWLRPGVTAVGIFDLVYDDGDGIVVVDWKTGLTPLSPKEARTDPQVLLYLLAARFVFPDRKVCVEVRYLSLDGYSVRVPWGPWLESLGRTWALAAYDEWSDPKTKSYATPGEHCADCQFAGRCRAYTEILRDPLTPRSHHGLQDLIAAREGFKAAEDGGAKERVKVDRELRSRLGHGLSAIKTSGGVVSLRERRTEGADGRLLLDVARQLGKPVDEVMERVGIVLDERELRMLKTLATEDDEAWRLIESQTDSRVTQWIEVRKVRRT